VQGAAGIADILFGKTSPSGKLPVTFYYDNYTTIQTMSNMDMRSWPGRTYRSPAVHAASRCACCLLLCMLSPAVIGCMECFTLLYPELCCAVLCCAVLCCAVLCCAVLCCAVLQQVMSAHTCFCLSFSFDVAMSLVHGNDKWHMTCNAITLHLQVMMSALMRPCFEYGA